MMVSQEHEEQNEPLRQAPEGLWLEAARGLQQAYKVFGIYLLYLLFRRPGAGGTLLATFVILTVLVFVYSWLKYRSVRFYIDFQKSEFIFSSGVFTHKRIVVHLDRIQQVNITQHLLQRLLNVHTLEISTAGSEKTEVAIRAVRLEDAERLKSQLLSGAGKEMTGDEHRAEEDVIRLSNATILKVALTSRYGRSLAIILAAAGAISNTFSDFARFNGEEVSSDAERLAGYLLQSTGFLILALLVFWFLLNLITGFVRFYNYSIKVRKGSLEVGYGLIKTRQVVIYPQKVQTVEIIRNFLQKKMDLSRLVLNQASSDSRRDQKASVEIPGCTISQQEELVFRVFGKQPAGVYNITPNFRKVFPPLFAFVLLPLAIILVLQVRVPYLPLVFAVWTFVSTLLIYIGFRRSRLMISEDFIIVQRGIWDVRRIMLQPYKLQGVTLSQRLWHRRAGIAHLTLYTAAGSVQFEFAKLDDIRPWVNKWLYDVESSDKNWM